MKNHHVHREPERVVDVSQRLRYIYAWKFRSESVDKRVRLYTFVHTSVTVTIRKAGVAEASLGESVGGADEQTVLMNLKSKKKR
jgi:hypothetical protein